jgi:hypothetical protein
MAKSTLRQKVLRLIIKVISNSLSLNDSAGLRKELAELTWNYEKEVELKQEIIALKNVIVQFSMVNGFQTVEDNETTSLVSEGELKKEHQR